MYVYCLTLLSTKLECGGVAMQHGAARGVDLGHGWNQTAWAPMATAIGFAALVAGWVACMVLVAALILRG
jgi:hypothetical protein